jgi:hypothetical protein
MTFVRALLKMFRDYLTSDVMTDELGKQWQESALI